MSCRLCEMRRQDRKARIWKKANGVCAHCGGTGAKRTIDHIIPQSAGGTYENENLMPLCQKCNSVRGNKPVADIDKFYPYASDYERMRSKAYVSWWQDDKWRSFRPDFS